MSDMNNWYETLNGNRPYTLSDVRQVQADAARLRSETVSRHIGLIGRGLWKAVSWVVGAAYRTLDGMAQGVAAMRLYEELNGLSDRELERLGTDRENLSRFVFLAVERNALTASGLYAIEGGLPADVAPAYVEQPSRRAA